MGTLEKIQLSLARLAAESGRSKITLTELARDSGISRPTLRKYIGGQAAVSEFMAEHGIHFMAPDAPNETIKQIQAAALMVFAENGYANTTMDAVAKEANLTKGALYWHFENKKDLFRHLMQLRARDGVEIAGERIEVAANTAKGDPLKLLSALISRQIEISKDEQAWWRLDFEFLAETRDPDLKQVLAPGMNDLIKSNQDKIQALQTAGMLSDQIDVPAISVLWQSMLIGLGYLSILEPDCLNNENLGNNIASSLWAGLQPDNES